MRIIAIVAAYNEERFIEGCIQHLAAQGIETYLCDNDSSDGTYAIAERYLGHGLCGLERLPRDGTYRWTAILEHKAKLAQRLAADWFLHLDADEIPLPPASAPTLAAALQRADAAGANAAEFVEFTFVPPREAPDHDHPDFRRTMRWYYPFEPQAEHLVRAWKRQAGLVDLASSGGHHVVFPGRRIYSERLRLRHYLFLSREHALRKYVARRYDPDEVRRGWHGWRATLTADQIRLPARAELRLARTDDELDFSNPRTTHCLLWT
jgi:glycosyltransferase involved in cell wall biosynthesis